MCYDPLNPKLMKPFTPSFALLLLSLAFSQAEKPNIIFFLADDLGYGDLTCYSDDSKIPTPNLDRLAKRSRVFDRAYCQGVWCAPSRTSFMPA